MDDDFEADVSVEGSEDEVEVIAADPLEQEIEFDDGLVPAAPGASVIGLAAPE
eukprot:gene92-4706_t